MNRYTLLVGKPPFQTKDVKNIYKKIKENNYEFPAELELSTESVDLISKILTTKPGNDFLSEFFSFLTLLIQQMNDLHSMKF